MEFTARRKVLHDRKIGTWKNRRIVSTLDDRKIRTLKDFITNPGLQFPIEFKQFKSNSPFPVKGIFSEIFHRQYALWKKGEAEGPYRYARDIIELTPLRISLILSMLAFLDKWNASQ